MIVTPKVTKFVRCTVRFYLWSYYKTIHFLGAFYYGSTQNAPSLQFESICDRPIGNVARFDAYAMAQQSYLRH